MSLRIAYFINQYPMVSHSFIRREILALERQGVDVLRIALRGWNEIAVDAEDEQEQKRTRYILDQGIFALCFALATRFLLAPTRFFFALRLALKMSSGSDRGLIYHLGYLAEACRMLPWLSSHRASHIHAHFGTNSAEVVMLAHELGGPPFSFTVHGPEEFDRPHSIGIAEKIHRAAFVVAISSFGRSQLYRWVGREFWSKIQVVHCGLEAAFHAVAAVPPPTIPRLVCVGRLCEQKGQLLLVEAMQALFIKGIAFELVLAGDGEMRADVESMITKYGLADRIRITGWISSEQVREEILAARALVLPSFAEGLPVVIMEAMALRRPVLTTFIAGIPELVRTGENGWLFPSGAIDELTRAIEQCLSMPADVMTKMGEAGYLRVLKRHSIDTEAGKLLALFRNAIAMPRGVS